MEYDIQLGEVTHPQPLAVVRLRARPQELSKVVPQACGIVWNVIRAQHITGAGRHVAIYLDGQINLEVGVELAAPFAGAGEVVGSSIPTGRVAKATHLGQYGKLHEVHTAIRDWCAHHRHTLAGPSWEIYGHWTDEWTTDPAKNRTDLCYLIRTDEVSAFAP